MFIEGFSAPTPGPSQSDSELSTNYELGYRLNLGPSQFELVGFFNDYSNITAACTESLCGISNNDQQFSAGAAEIRGLELQFVDNRSWNAWLSTSLRINYALTQSEFTSDFDSQFPLWGEVNSGDEMPYTPEHQLSAVLGVAAWKFDLGLAYSYVSPMRDVAGSDDEELGGFGKTDPQHIVDLSFAYKPVKSSQFYLRVDNVFNDRAIVSFRPYGARPTKPIAVQIGFKTDFSLIGSLQEN